MMDPQHGKAYQPEQSCRLLKLPPEIRNHIWTLACTPLSLNTHPAVKTVHASRSCAKFNRQQLAITRTCREIRDEALPLFYANGPFVVRDLRTATMNALKIWLSAIGKSVHHLELITLSTPLNLYLERGSPIDFLDSDMHVKLMVQQGQPIFDVSVPLDHPNEGLGAWMEDELKSALAKKVFKRSERLRKSTPGLACHEWVSMIYRMDSCLRNDFDKFQSAAAYLRASAAQGRRQ